MIQVLVQLGLSDPDAPHGDDDHGIAGDEKQVDAEEQVVEDISYMAPLLLQLALLLQRGKVGAEVAQVLTDLLQFRQSSSTWQVTVMERSHTSQLLSRVGKIIISDCCLLAYLHCWFGAGQELGHPDG